GGPGGHGVSCSAAAAKRKPRPLARPGFCVSVRQRTSTSQREVHLAMIDLFCPLPPSRRDGAGRRNPLPPRTLRGCGVGRAVLDLPALLPRAEVLFGALPPQDASRTAA